MKGVRKMRGIKYKHQRIDMTARVSPELFKIISEISFSLGVTKQDLIIMALLKTYDNGEQCPDRQHISQLF